MSQKNKSSPKPSPKNTLFNYFNKNTPTTQEKAGIVEKKETPTLNKKKLEFGKIYSLIAVKWFN